MTQPTVCKHKAKTDAAHFKQARVDGTEVTNVINLKQLAHMVQTEKIACETVDNGPTLGVQSLTACTDKLVVLCKVAQNMLFLKMKGNL